MKMSNISKKVVKDVNILVYIKSLRIFCKVLHIFLGVYVKFFLQLKINMIYKKHFKENETKFAISHPAILK